MEAAAPQPQALTSVLRAPLSRLSLVGMKPLVKVDPGVMLVEQGAIFLLACAAELFVETVAKDSPAVFN